jgi:hypothetical protein
MVPTAMFTSVTMILLYIRNVNGSDKEQVENQE